MKNLFIFIAVGTVSALYLPTVVHLLEWHMERWAFFYSTLCKINCLLYDTGEVIVGFKEMSPCDILCIFEVEQAVKYMDECPGYSWGRLFHGLWKSEIVFEMMREHWLPLFQTWGKPFQYNIWAPLPPMLSHNCAPAQWFFFVTWLSLAFHTPFFSS